MIVGLVIIKVTAQKQQNTLSNGKQMVIIIIKLLRWFVFLGFNF
jgi:hypothetical protein